MESIEIKKIAIDMYNQFNLNIDYSILLPFASYMYTFNNHISNLASDKYCFNQITSGYFEGFVLMNNVIHIDQNLNQILNIKQLDQHDGNRLVIHCGPSSIDSNLELSIAHASNLYVIANIENNYNKALSNNIMSYFTNNLEKLKTQFQDKIDLNKNLIFNIINIIKFLNIKEVDIHNFFNKDQLYSSSNIVDILSKNKDILTLIHDLNFESELKKIKSYTNISYKKN